MIRFERFTEEYIGDAVNLALSGLQRKESIVQISPKKILPKC